MINIYCLFGICHLEINHFRIDLLTAFFTQCVVLPWRSHWSSSQTHEQAEMWGKERQQTACQSARHTQAHMLGVCVYV